MHYFLFLLTCLLSSLDKEQCTFSLFIDLNLLSSIDKEDKEQCIVFSFYWPQSPLIPWQITMHYFLSSHPLTKNSALFSLFIDLSLLSSLDKEQCTIPQSPLLRWQRTMHYFLFLLISVSFRPLTKNNALFSLSFDLKFPLVFWQTTGEGVWSFETFL